MKIISLFSGCGGLDLGFTQSGFDVVFSNDIYKGCWKTYEINHGIKIDKRDISHIPSDEIPDADGIIGGPPCQSWSLAGSMNGINDKRGKLFYEYIRIIKDKKPKFFVAENVPGMISSAHIDEFEKIITILTDIGYNVSYKPIMCKNFGVPQDRVRIIIVGYRSDLIQKFIYPTPTHSRHGMVGTSKWKTLKDAIFDLRDPANLLALNQHYYVGGFSSMYMSRNRRRSWNEQSFTILASGRHAPLHPDGTRMVKVSADKWKFDSDDPKIRRLSVRECARIQTFPDNFIFYYDNVDDGYKMVGNAVPPLLSKAIASKIKSDFELKKLEKKEDLNGN